MRYVSTRGQAPELGFADALLAGLAVDGGLLVPVEWPELPPPAELDGAGGYAEIAQRIVAPFVGGDIAPDVLGAMCRDAYATFRHPAVVPLVQLDDRQWLAELYHGPTLAFKDVALQLVGRLFDHVLGQRGDRVTIVGATSGDTGSAAIEAMRDCAHVDIVVLYPAGGPSEVQRRQMTTVDAPNVRTVAVDGTFDDCQDLVKAMFNDAPFRERMRLSAVNSINWARVMAQVVYYVTTARALAGPVRMCVPTGNFGNVFAGWLARRMGTPIEDFVIASNANDILTRFVNDNDMSTTASGCSSCSTARRSPSRTSPCSSPVACSTTSWPAGTIGPRSWSPPRATPGRRPSRPAGPVTGSTSSCCTRPGAPARCNAAR